MLTVSEWQRQFFASPVLWLTLDRDGEVSNAYESKEAALLEVAWDARRPADRRAGLRVQALHVHSLHLARERWEERTVAPAPGGAIP